MTLLNEENLASTLSASQIRAGLCVARTFRLALSAKTFLENRRADTLRRIMMLFPHPVEELLRKTMDGDEPKERLYGLIELRERGWKVDVNDSRFSGFSGAIRRHFGWLINPINVSTLRDLQSYDLLVVKDDFSLSALVAAKLLRKRIVFVDSMFTVPKRFWRRISATLCIRFADATLAFSDTQRKEWVDTLTVPRDRLHYTPFAIDVPFYQTVPSDRSGKSFVLAVGRDMGRDFQTLVSATVGTGLSIELVTMPYLSDSLRSEDVDVSVTPYLPYPALFSQYARAIAAVIPLKRGITYPSGIRAVLEAMVLGAPVIATRTPVLEEFFVHGDHLLFSEPESVDSMNEQLRFILEDSERARKMAARAQALVNDKFGMRDYADAIERLLMQILDSDRR